MGGGAAARAAVAAGMALVVMASAACGGHGSKGRSSLVVGGDTVPARRLTDAAAGLCRARTQVGGDLVGARATFYDRSHESLHTIARALDPVDRALEARLLEAMQVVEADLSRPAPQPSMVADLAALVQVTRAGLQRLAIAVPSCAGR